MLEASRDAISVSTRVRRNSSGVQRWVLAVTSSSGASRRIAPSCRRRSPASRSAGRTGVGAVMTGRRSRRPTTVGWRRLGGRRSVRRRVGSDGRHRCPAARIDRTSWARNRPKRTARSSAVIRASRPWAASRPASSSRSPASDVIPAAAAALMNVSAAGPRPQNAISAAVLGRTARRGAGRAPP